MQVGTLSGNPLAVAAGLKTLEILQRPGQYEKLERTGQTLMQGFVRCLKAAGHSAQSIGHPTLFDVVFSSGSVENYREVLLGNKDKAAHFNSTLRKNRILKIPGKFYISLALTDDDIAKTLGIVEDAASALPN